MSSVQDKDARSHVCVDLQHQVKGKGRQVDYGRCCVITTNLDQITREWKDCELASEDEVCAELEDGNNNPTTLRDHICITF